MLDLLEGGSLSSRCWRAAGGCGPARWSLRSPPVAAALAPPTSNGVVHGDLSPGNIVFTGEGRPVLTDLGVARVLGETAAAEVTPAYVDPTVARGAAPGPASDVFGVRGSGVPRADRRRAVERGRRRPSTLADRGWRADCRTFAELAPDAPPALLAVVRLAGSPPYPHDRGSAAAFALDLRHACRPEPVRLPTDGVPDAELALTGRGPRTELTHHRSRSLSRRHRRHPWSHQAPRGRPGSADHVSARPERLRERSFRPGTRLPSSWRGRALVVAALVILVVGHSAVAVRLGRPGRGGLQTSVPGAVRFLSAPPTRAETGRSLSGWTEVVAALYRRAAAFADRPRRARSGRRLRDRQPGAGARTRRSSARSPGPARCCAGFAPTVVEVTRATTTGIAPSSCSPTGGPPTTSSRLGRARGPARPAPAGTRVRMTLQRTAAGWRIADAERLS